MADIQGSYDLCTAVPSALAGLLEDGDVGASVAVFVAGEPVVDVWGGFADTDARSRGGGTRSPMCGPSPRR